MAKTVALPIKDLVIDLQNFRTVVQPDEMQAVQAMISIGSDELWALMESLIDDGYLPTENIIVLEVDGTNKHLLVKEGNRRIAALKLILGYLPLTGFSIPEKIVKKIAKISSAWKAENEHVPCAVYSPGEATIADKIVTLTHGKDEKAGRHNWNAVARARHNRDINKAPEYALDLLERYLVHGENLNKLQAKLWAGKYPLSVLDEALPKLGPRFEAKNGPDLARTYPAITNKAALDNILHDIGMEIISFPTLRQRKDVWEKYLSQPIERATAASSLEQGCGTNSTPSTANSNMGNTQPQNSGTQTNTTGEDVSSGTQTSTSKPDNVVSVPINDPRSIKRTLKKFAPIGNNRQKVVTLRNEARCLDLNDNPVAFCFLLRSMFEISAKAYCDDHKSDGGPSFTKQNGEYNTLEVVLRGITTHLTKNKKDMAMVKELHGAMTELEKKHSILSVTSMNQLVHHPTFTIVSSDIPALFANVFPLLEAMNS